MLYWESVPKEFQLLHHHIQVKEIPVPDVGKYGDTDFNTQIVRVFRDPDTSDDTMLHTYFHELVHLLLEYAGYPEDSKDETKVDVLGGLLAQWYKTGRDLPKSS